MATTISIEPQDDLEYLVTVEERGTRTLHRVKVWPSDVEHYAPGATPEELLHASFEFLLAREPKEAILGRFELPMIERYFSDYPRAMAGLGHRD